MILLSYGAGKKYSEIAPCFAIIADTDSGHEPQSYAENLAFILDAVLCVDWQERQVAERHGTKQAFAKWSIPILGSFVLVSAGMHLARRLLAK